jgi:hypothetical protein
MFATEAEAVAAATDNGCEGAHQMGAEWMPGATHGACKMGKCDCRKDESSEWSPTCDEKKGKMGGHGGHHDHDSHGNHSGHRMLAEEEDALYA